MVRGTVIKRDDGYVITIPSEEVARLNLREGQVVIMEMQPAENGNIASSERVDSHLETVAAIREGIASAEHGELKPAEQVLAEMQAKYGLHG
ncbi:MAG: hypothetical protein ACR2JY_02000 [Chloroflexota bacterium]